MLDNQKGVAFTDLPYFNKNFISANHIKALNGHFQYKKTGEAIKNSQFLYQYHFDREGRLTYSFETKLLGSIVDTLVLYYEYDAKNNLSVLRQKMGDSYFTTKYDYDPNNRVIKESYYKDIDTTNDNYLNPTFERSTFLSAQKYEYQYNGTQLKKTFYNNYNIPYQDEYITNNSLGLISKVETVIRTTSKRIITNYEYDDNGWISKISVKSPEETKIKEFHYDKRGNLLDEQIYRNDQHLTDIQIIYSKISGLLSYTLKHDIDTGLITILKIDKVIYY